MRSGVGWSEANLGDGLFKKRLARPGGGKSGGYRAIVASSLTPQGHAALAKASAVLLAADERGVAALAASGDIMEVDCDGIGEG